MHPAAVDALRDGAGGEGLDGAGRAPHGGATDPETLDFSANVNPEVPAGARTVYREAFDAAGRYPDDDYPAFRRAAAAAVDCDPDQVVPTAGATAAIRLALATTLEPGDSTLVPAPSYAEYGREVRLQGGEPAVRPPEDLLAADLADHAVAVVCHPNNPTGTAYDAAALDAFAERCRGAGTTLLVDEAFLGFTDRPTLAGTPGVVVVRSLTKLFGLPGLRAGYAVATGDLRDRLATARSPWSLGTPAARTGTYCLGRSAFVERTRERVASERDRMADRLRRRFDVAPSAAPFLLLECASPAAVDEVLRTLSAAGIAARDARSFRGLDAHLRVAVRLPDENDRLLAALEV